MTVLGTRRRSIAATCHYVATLARRRVPREPVRNARRDQDHDRCRSYGQLPTAGGATTPRRDIGRRSQFGGYWNGADHRARLRRGGLQHRRRSFSVKGTREQVALTGLTEQ